MHRSWWPLRQRRPKNTRDCTSYVGRATRYPLCVAPGPHRRGDLYRPLGSAPDGIAQRAQGRVRVGDQEREEGEEVRAIRVVDRERWRWRRRSKRPSAGSCFWGSSRPRRTNCLLLSSDQWDVDRYVGAGEAPKHVGPTSPLSHSDCLPRSRYSTDRKRLHPSGRGDGKYCHPHIALKRLPLSTLANTLDRGHRDRLPPLCGELPSSRHGWKEARTMRYDD